jgi:hypothetical protein
VSWKTTGASQLRVVHREVGVDPKPSSTVQAIQWPPCRSTSPVAMPPDEMAHPPLNRSASDWVTGTIFVSTERGWPFFGVASICRFSASMTGEARAGCCANARTVDTALMMATAAIKIQSSFRRRVIAHIDQHPGHTSGRRRAYSPWCGCPGMRAVG